MVEYWQRFEDKVLSLKSFSGYKTKEQLEWSPLEKQLLSLLRKARTELPLFTDDDRPRSKLAWEFQRFLGDKSKLPDSMIPERWRIPPEVQRRWDRIDRKPYQEVVRALAKWLDEAYDEQITPAKIRSSQMLVRASHLFYALKLDVKRKHDPGSRADKKLDTGVYYAFEELQEAGLVKADAKAESAEMDEISSLESILHEYLQTAREHNPMFDDLGEVLSRDTIVERYDSYVESGRAPAEQKAYDRAFQALEIHAGLLEGDLSTLQAKQPQVSIGEKEEQRERRRKEAAEEPKRTDDRGQLQPRSMDDRAAAEDVRKGNSGEAAQRANAKAGAAPIDDGFTWHWAALVVALGIALVSAIVFFIYRTLRGGKTVT